MHKRIELPGGGSDEVAVEEPLEIRLGGRPIAVTMRTPGADEELALGFLYGEALIDGARETSLGPELEANTIEVDGEPLRDPGERNFYASSSCGVCGKGAIEQIDLDAPTASPGPRLPASLLASLPSRLSQPAFELTGGLHATGLFDTEGRLLCVREDVGRHNAMDKAIGWALGEGRLPLRDTVAVVSGRLSFELVQKAAMAGCPILVAVGAPSSLAIELAKTLEMTLCGFVREEGLNLYCGPERLS